MFSHAEAPCTPVLSPFLNLLPEETTAWMWCLCHHGYSQVKRFNSLFCLTVALPDSLGTRRTKVVLRMWVRVYFHRCQQPVQDRGKWKTYWTGHTVACKDSESRFHSEFCSLWDQNKLPLKVTVNGFVIRDWHVGQVAPEAGSRSSADEWRRCSLGAGKTLFTFYPAEGPACELAFPVGTIDLSFWPNHSLT